jgi:hypothetical protein
MRQQTRQQMPEFVETTTGVSLYIIQLHTALEMLLLLVLRRKGGIAVPEQMLRQAPRPG